MARYHWPFSKPVGLAAGLSSRELNDQYRQLEIKTVLTHKGHRFGFRLAQSADVLVQISSSIASSNNWHRAGYLASLLFNAPIAEPVQEVERIYFGQQHLSISYTGLDHYFEFWPHLWITDYRIELWAKEALPVVSITLPNSEDNKGLLFFNIGQGLPTEEFTFFGELINFP